MSKKFGSGGNKSNSGGAKLHLYDKQLLPRIESYVKQYLNSNNHRAPSVDDIVEYLRNNYAEYKRQKLAAVTNFVHATIENKQKQVRQHINQQANNNNNNPNNSNEPIDVHVISSDDESQSQSQSHASNTANNNPKKKRRRSSKQPDSANGNVDNNNDDEESNSDTENMDDNDGVDLVQVDDKNIVNSSLRTLYKTPSKNNLIVNNNNTNNEDKLNEKSKDRRINRKKLKQNAKRNSEPEYQPNYNNANPGDFQNWHPEINRSNVNYSQLGGIESILQDIREQIEYPLTHPEIYKHLGVEPPRGILLHGAPGCGKTLLANAIAGELGVPFLKISAPEIVSGMSGESEAKLRTLFNDALNCAPSIIFIDEIDSITGKRENAQREMERRIVAQLLTCLDSLSTQYLNNKSRIVIVIGATNRPDSLDPALRRAGRFDREICIPMPDEHARAKILQTMCKDMKLEGGEEKFDFASIAKAAVGFVGADLAALTREAAILAVNRIFKQVLPTPTLKPAQSTNIKVESMQLPSNIATNTSINNIMSTSVFTPNPTIENNSATATSLLSNLHIKSSSTSTEPSNVNSILSSIETTTNNDMAITMNGDESSSMPVSSASMLLTNYTNAKQAAQHAELTARSTASDKLRAHIEPLNNEQLSGLSISMLDFQEAVKKVQPSAKREGFATIPDVTWNDIGALDELRDELNMSIFQPIRNPEQYSAIGLTIPAGVLLFGPPGCGKTLVAKAIANESGASFLSIKGPELLNQYVGQSERAVRRVFERAASSKPCVIFFDELDALAPKRSSSGSDNGGSQVSERVVNQLLTAMDGLNERTGIFVIAATNRPDIIDPAMLRPGRLDKLLYVPLPNQQERASILQKHMRQTPLECLRNVNDPIQTNMIKDNFINSVAAHPHLNGFSGADLCALVREATIQALKEAQVQHAKLQQQEAKAAGIEINVTDHNSHTKRYNTPLSVYVSVKHFELAFTKVFPSVSETARKRYEKMKRTLCTSRAINTEEINNSINNNNNNNASINSNNSNNTIKNEHMDL